MPGRIPDHLVQSATHWSGPAIRAFALPAFVVVGLLVFIPAAGYRRRRSGP